MNGLPQRWPSNGEYVASVHDLEWCFSDEELRRGSIRESVVIGIPECATGQNAIVFPIDCGARKWAIRCFTNPADEGQRRYEAYSAYASDLYCRPLVTAEWLAKGIRTDGGWWPVVKMEWIEGHNLNEVVAAALDDSAKLRGLADQWRATVRALRNAKIAHGDLQHGNVLMDDTGALRLVDYDGIWIPAIAELSNREVGHPNYQHPERIRTGHWDQYVDAFSALVIYTSLRALAADPSLWDLNNGENLILRDKDYADPSTSAVWPRLNRSPDHEVRSLADLLVVMCRTTVKIATDLDEILDTRRIPDAKIWAPKWWEKGYDGTTPAASSSTAVVSKWGETEPEGADGREQGPQPSLDDDDDEREWGIDWRVAVIVFLVMVALAAAGLAIYFIATGG